MPLKESELSKMSVISAEHVLRLIIMMMMHRWSWWWFSWWWFSWWWWWWSLRTARAQVDHDDDDALMIVMMMAIFVTMMKSVILAEHLLRSMQSWQCYHFQCREVICRPCFLFFIGRNVTIWNGWHCNCNGWYFQAEPCDRGLPLSPRGQCVRHRLHQVQDDLYRPHYHCTMCILGSMFTFQPNKLRHILKDASW